MIDKKNRPLIVILGPTASGKTKLAVRVASKIDGEIISADSRQVYKGMTIGTGKDYEEYFPFFKPKHGYFSGIEGVHLIDLVAAGDAYNVAFFQRDFQQVYEQITARNKIPILCGGTGMYVEAVLRNYKETQVPINELLRKIIEVKTDEELRHIFQEKYFQANPNANVSTRKRLIRAIEIGDWKLLGSRLKLPQITHLLEPQNKPLITQIFAIDIPSEVRRARITNRLHNRLQNGMIEEVKSLLKNGISAEKLIFYGLEYKFITEYLLGNLAYEEMTKRLETAIHQFAKRQMTFFRSMERKGFKINWLDGMLSAEEMAELIMNTTRV